MCCSRFEESKLHCNTAFRAKQLREVEGFSFLSDKQNEALRLVSEPRPTVSNCQEGSRALDRDVGCLREFFVSGRISPALGGANHVKTSVLSSALRITMPRMASVCCGPRPAGIAISLPWWDTLRPSQPASGSQPRANGSMIALTANSSKPDSCAPHSRVRPTASRSTSRPAGSEALVRFTLRSSCAPLAKRFSTSSR